MTVTDLSESPDGRHRRSLDSRARIVAAMMELVHETAAPPSAEQVAARAQVGLRSVFRHFKDMDGLYAEMAGVIEAELYRVLEQPFLAQEWTGRVVELVGRRSAVFEIISPVKRAADAVRHRSKVPGSDQPRLVAGLRMALLRVMPEAEQADRERLEALDLLLSWESWSRLRHDQGLSVAEAQAVLEAAVRRQLAG